MSWFKKKPEPKPQHTIYRRTDKIEWTPHDATRLNMFLNDDSTGDKLIAILDDFCINAALRQDVSPDEMNGMLTLLAQLKNMAPSPDQQRELLEQEERRQEQVEIQQENNLPDLAGSYAM
jgi:hypothetical protein